MLLRRLIAAALGIAAITSAALAQSSGNAACDDFVKKVEACLPKIPAAERGTYTTLVVHAGSPDVDIVQVEFRDTDRPDRAHVFVATGCPDPLLLRPTLEGASIAGVEGRFW